MTVRGDESPEPSWLVVGWMLAAVAVHPFARIYAANTAGVDSTWMPIAISAALALVAIGVTVILARFGVDRSAASYGMTLFMLLLLYGRALLPLDGVAAWLAIVLTSICFALLAKRLARLTLTHATMFLLAAYVTAAPWYAWATADREPEDDYAGVEQFGSGTAMHAADLYLVVVDGHPGITTLGHGLGWSAGTRERLEDQGFVFRDAWSPYSTTHFSMSSFFDASYVVEPVAGSAPYSRNQLKPRYGGDGALFGFLHASGYRITILEPPWIGFKCTPSVDACVRTSYLDDFVYYALEPSLIGSALDRQFGSPWHIGARSSFTWLERNARELASNGFPDFVYAHVLVPHPPFLFGADCRIDYRPEFDWVVVNPMQATRERVERAQLMQIECVGRMLEDLVAELPTDAIIVLMSDHGWELDRQLTRDPRTWTSREALERLNVLFAMRGPRNCEPAEPAIHPNVARALLRCLGAESVEDLDVRMFIGQGQSDTFEEPLIEIDPSILPPLLEAGSTDDVDR